MKNSEYWEKRIAEPTWNVYNNLEEKNISLLEMYQEASLNISDELYRVAEKVKTATPTISDMHKFNRLSNLQNNINYIIKELGNNVENFGKKNMYDGFSVNYKATIKSLDQVDFAMPNKKLMEEMLSRPWLGKNFSQRLWKNTKVLAMNLNDILTTGLTQGKTVTEMSIQLNNRMNAEFNKAHTLIRTETMHYLNESSFKAYEDAGCTEVQVWAAVDERTCPTCGIRHGNIYKMRDRPTLPFHARCRCTYLPVVNIDDSKKDYDKAKDNIKNEFNRREQPEEKIKDKMRKNYDRDKEQYKKYKDILGSTAPKTFENFQNLKYNKLDEWNQLKNNFNIVNMYKVDFGYVSPGKILELDKLAFEAKRENQISKYKKQGNFAVLQYNDSIKFASSRISTVDDNEYIKYKGNKEQLVLLKNNRRFKTMNIGDMVDNKLNTVPRYFDTEAKFFEFLSDNSQDQEIKEVFMLSEKSMCESCKNVVKQFLKKYPNIELNIISGKTFNGWKGR